MNRGVFFVVMHAQLCGVAREQKILAVRIGNDDLLIAQRHGIQATVGVLLQEIEIGDVVLPPVRIQVAEQTHAGLLFYEQEAAKVAMESLDAGPHRNEIVIRAQVVQLHFGERFLQSEMRIQARGAFAHVHIDDAEFLHIQIVQADDGRDADAPVHRTKRSIAVKQVEGKRKSLIEEDLVAFAEKIAASRPRRADVGGRGQAPAVEKRVAGSRQNQKSLLADNRHIAFQFIAIERVPPAGFHVRMFAADSVAIPIGHGDRPAIGFGMKDLISWRKRFGRGLRAGLLEIAGLYRAGRSSGRRRGLRSYSRIGGYGRKSRKLRLCRRDGGKSDQRNFTDEIVAGFQLYGGLAEILEVCCDNFQLIVARSNVYEAEDSLRVADFFDFLIRG